MAQLWNAMRTCRMLLHQILQAQILEGLLSDPPEFSQGEADAQIRSSTGILVKMQADLLASFPYFSPPGEKTSESRAAREHFILWSLHHAAIMSVTTEPLREWILNRLRTIAKNTALLHASIIVELLENQRSHKVQSPEGRENQQFLTLNGGDG